MQTVDDTIAEVLKREGWPAYTNHPADRGGPTKGGITLAAWRQYIGNPAASAADLQAITEEQARAFYRNAYILKPKFDRIESPPLRELVVDCGVHHGTRRASKWLQRAAGVTQDGIIGAITLATVNQKSPRALYLDVLAYRLRLFGRLVGRDPELHRATEAGFALQARWAGGWNNRAASFVAQLASRLHREHEWLRDIESS